MNFAEYFLVNAVYLDSNLARRPTPLRYYRLKFAPPKGF